MNDGGCITAMNNIVTIVVGSGNVNTDPKQWCKQLNIAVNGLELTGVYE